jgi:hypothetical protein
MTKATGHCFFSPGASVYWLKQKHSSLLKCAPPARRVARDGLRGHAAVLHVLELVHHRGQLARVHLHRALRRLEVPGATRVGVELDRDGAAAVDLRVAAPCAPLTGHGPGHLRSDSDSTLMPALADGAVHRHQRIAEAEHAAPPPPACPASAVVASGAAWFIRAGQAPSTTDLGHEAQPKNTAPPTPGSAPGAGWLALLFGAPGVILHRRISRSRGWRWRPAWAASRRCGRAPATALPTPGPRRLPRASAAPSRPCPRIIGQHDEEEEVHLHQPKPKAPTEAIALKSANCIG